MIAMSQVPLPEIKLLYHIPIILSRKCQNCNTITLVINFKMTLHKLMFLRSLMRVGKETLGIRTINVLARWVSISLVWKAQLTTLQISSPIVSKFSLKTIVSKPSKLGALYASILINFLLCHTFH